MKKESIPYIVIAILAAVLIFRGEGRGNQVRQVNKLIKQSEARQVQLLDSIARIINQRQAIGRDCTIIIQRYEKLRANPITDRVGDSLAREILRAKAVK